MPKFTLSPYPLCTPSNVPTACGAGCHCDHHIGNYVKKIAMNLPQPVAAQQ